MLSLLLLSLSLKVYLKICTPLTCTMMKNKSHIICSLILFKKFPQFESTKIKGFKVTPALKVLYSNPSSAYVKIKIKIKKRDKCDLSLLLCLS